MKHDSETNLIARHAWVKSSYSGNNGNCLEAAVLRDGRRALRDSKNPGGPVLSFDSAGFATFVRGIVRGEFN